MSDVSGVTLRQWNEDGRGVVFPFHDRAVFQGMTYGVGPSGYDIRIAQTLRIPPGEFRLASSIEEFAVPNHVNAKVYDKSSWARRGLSLFNTVIEPGWRGFLTLEICNHSRQEITIEEGSPIAQIIFTYLDRTTFPYEGKYQDQINEPVGPLFDAS